MAVHWGNHPLFNSTIKKMIAATHAAAYPQIHCSIFSPLPPGRKPHPPEPRRLRGSVGPEAKRAETFICPAGLFLTTSDA